MAGMGTFLGWVSILKVLRSFLVAPKPLRDEEKMLRGRVASCNSADATEPLCLAHGSFLTHCSPTLSVGSLKTPQ